MARLTRHSPESTKDWLTDQAVLALLIVGLTIVFGFILGEIQAKVGWLILTIALVFILIMIGTFVILVRRPLQRELAGGFEDIKAAIGGSSHSGY